MNNNSYLIFSFNQLDYAISTLTVQEIFLLPEVTLIPESPADIVGVINLRGVIVPIMDLNRRFGYSDQKYRLNDNVVIINWENVRVGIIVNQVEDIKTISTDEITGELSHDQYFEGNAPERFISGFAQYLERIITILKVESILRYVDEQNLGGLEIATEESEESEEVIPLKTAIFCAHLTDHEREILHNRADHLRQVNFKRELTSVQPLAVVKFSDEFFGVDLKLVREFTNITRVTPIPCTPPHIVGNLNLRGEILTLIDLSNFLQLNTALVNQRQKAMVVQVEDVVAGITVDSVYDVILLDTETITEVPSSYVINQDYLHGVVSYQDRMLSILNLTGIFATGGLLVDEAV